MNDRDSVQFFEDGTKLKKKTSEINPFFKKLNDDEASDDEDDTGLLPASRGYDDDDDDFDEDIGIGQSGSG